MIFRSLKPALNIVKCTTSCVRYYKTECSKVESAFSLLSLNSFQNERKPSNDTIKLNFSARSIIYNKIDTTIQPPTILDISIPKIPNIIPNYKKDIINDVIPLINDLECPTLGGNAIEKKAERMIIQRRRKMKKHQLKKWRKKYKFLLKKRNQRKALRKEKVFQAKLLAQIKIAENFDPEKYVVEKLKKAADVPEYVPYKRPGITGNIIFHPGLPDETQAQKK